MSLGHGPYRFQVKGGIKQKSGVCNLGGSVQEWTSSEFLDASSREQDTASGQPRFVVKGRQLVAESVFCIAGLGASTIIGMRHRHSFVGFRCVKSID